MTEPEKDRLPSLYDAFFNPDAQVVFERDEIIVTKPDGRRLIVRIKDIRFENPNATPLPPFDFRDQLKGEGEK